jgi:hypothetical protein
MIYILYSPVHNVLDAYISITKGSGRGLGPGIPEFFGPQMELAYRLIPIHRVQKLGNSSAQPHPTSPRNGYSRIQKSMHNAV